MADVDPINAVVKFLRDDAAVAARVAARVFSEELPLAEKQHMPRQCVLVTSAGGGALGRGNNFGDQRLDVTCYGATKAQARQLYRLAVRPALKHLQREVVADSATTSVLLHWARISGDGVTGRDPDTDWPVCMSAWQVLASEVSAA